MRAICETKLIDRKNKNELVQMLVVAVLNKTMVRDTAVTWYEHI